MKYLLTLLALVAAAAAYLWATFVRNVACAVNDGMRPRPDDMVDLPRPHSAPPPPPEQ